jgi:FtsH-binding integral membrane protein
MPQRLSTPAGLVAMTRDEGLAKFQANVLLLMGFGLMVTGAVGAVVVNNPDLLSYFLVRDGNEPSLTGTWWIVTALEFVLILGMSGWDKRTKDSPGSIIIFVIYAALNGLTIAPVMSLYTGASIFQVCSITAVTFGASGLWGLTTKRNLSGAGSFLLMGLVGLIVLMLANFVFRSSAINFVVTFVGLVLFIGLTAYDMNKLTAMYDAGGNRKGLVVDGALTLYLDFINLLLLFLRIFGVKKD